MNQEALKFARMVSILYHEDAKSDGYLALAIVFGLIALEVSPKSRADVVRDADVPRSFAGIEQDVNARNVFRQLFPC